MKRLLNTLFVTTQGAYLCREGETVCVRVEKETKLRVPIHTLSGIVCFGQVSCSPPLIGLCGERNVLISFHSEHGRFLGRVQGPISGNVLLRREQYRRADDLQAAAAIARNIVTAKVANCRTVVLRAVRDHATTTDTQALTKAAAELGRIAGALQQAGSLASVRGQEGDAAQTYFSVFNHLIVAQKSDFQFRERSRRPPLSSMNALLSFLYALLAHDVTAALESVGLDPAVGFLHRDRPGRPSLALDLMEELRPILADRLALTLVNLRKVRASGFTKTETGAVVMDDKTRKQVLVSWQKRKTEEITHPFLGERVAVGLLPYAQALLLARHLRGDLDGYPPYIWR
ncbi:MAG: CRISPR-associated protein Cas1 [Candidatus Bipolaricaulis sibiricus]|uniref:CRISPR-associated endonuclease Cas1 n=1 Tax=Bipolaricaulis sibiricus TaxID=2501609 RepID=A0A410FUW0_BIPS1|nr:MAG: CRISPR-associated protein Cas1 [Candidatus Bipolaricaulis sibiricus]